MTINDSLRQIQYLKATKKLTKAEITFLDRIRRELLRGRPLNVAEAGKLKEMTK